MRALCHPERSRGTPDPGFFTTATFAQNDAGGRSLCSVILSEAKDDKKKQTTAAAAAVVIPRLSYARALRSLPAERLAIRTRSGRRLTRARLDATLAGF